jgi:acetyltransferase-like isoleucine patch superfamily enzyme
MSRVMEGLIRRLKRDPGYRLEEPLTSRDVLHTLVHRCCQAFRGLLFRPWVRSCHGLLFCGRHVTIWHGYALALGRNVILEDNVLINALSLEGIVLGNNVTVRRGASLVASGVIRRKGVGIRIGDDSSVGDSSYLAGQGGIEIGKDVLLGPGVMIFSEDHRMGDTRLPIRQQGETRAPVVIEDDCWIGAGSILLKGVRLGRGTVVAAGSVVTHDVPAFSVVAGVPARFLRGRCGEMAPEG